MASMMMRASIRLLAVSGDVGRSGVFDAHAVILPQTTGIPLGSPKEKVRSGLPGSELVLEFPGAGAVTADRVDPVAVPVADHRDPGGITEVKLEVGGAARGRLAQHPFRPPHDSDAIDPVTVPIADHRDVTGLAEIDHELGTSGRVAVAQEPLAFPEHPGACPSLCRSSLRPRGCRRASRR